MKNFLKDIFIKQLVCLIIVLGLLGISDNYIVDYLLLLILLLMSITYFLSSKFSPLNRKRERDKPALVIRQLVIFLYLIIVWMWLKIFLSSFGFKIDDGKQVFTLLLAYYLSFSLFAIMLGIKLRTLLLLMIVALPVVVLVGVFDVKWWALITGFLTLWNFINSEEFLLFLRRGKKLREIPENLKYEWATNKLTAYLATFLFYISLIISSVFEKRKPKLLVDYLDNATKRVYTFLVIVVVLAFIGGFMSCYFYLLNSKKEFGKIGTFILNVGDKCRLAVFNKKIQFYIKAKQGELT